jgi:hypothetical protein
MVRRSNKSISEILSSTKVPLTPRDDNHDDLSSLERKITLATEGFTTHKFCELVLKDRNRLSKENALTICNYVIAMKREINVRLTRNTLSKF